MAWAFTRPGIRLGLVPFLVSCRYAAEILKYVRKIKILFYLKNELNRNSYVEIKCFIVKNIIFNVNVNK